MLASRAISPAANRWQAGLLGALCEEGIQLTLLGHRPEPCWPRGALRVQGGTSHEPLRASLPPVPRVLTGYWNLPWLRDASLAGQYCRAFQRMLDNGFRPDGVLCYNLPPFSVAIARDAEKAGIPWVPVMADAPGDPVAFARLQDHVRTAAGSVILSWQTFSDWSSTPKLHLDGGVTMAPDGEVDVPSADAPKVILYSGVMNQYGGVDLLLDAFALMRDPNVRLWICGRGDNRKIQPMLRADTRITFLGYLAEDELRRISRQAWVMVNPRPGHVSGNEHNFPSKVLEYFSYGKPVVSTLTPGLAPGYREVVAPVDAYTPQALAKALEKVLLGAPAERAERCQQICRFIKTEKTWTIQGRRLTKWLSDEVLKTAATVS